MLFWGFPEDRTKRELFFVDPITGRYEILGKGDPRSFTSNAEFSRDGTRVAYLDENNRLAVVNVDGTGRRVLPMQGDRALRDPTWSADGLWLGFWRDNYLLGDRAYWIRADGTSAHDVSLVNAWESRHPQWSPDGSRIAFDGRLQDQTDPWPRVQVTNARGEVTVLGLGERPRWTSDGEWIVFHRFLGADGACGNSYHHYEVFAVRPDGSDERQLTHTPNRTIRHCDGSEIEVFSASRYPLPAPDGKSILYYDGHQGLSSMGLDGGARGAYPIVAPTEFLLSRVVDWQPIPARLTVRVFDGSPADRHINPMAGVQVELRQNGAVTATPDVTSVAGEYHFRAVPPGKYRVRVSLLDDEPGGPLYQLHHEVPGGDPVWIEVDVTVPVENERVTVIAGFSDTSDVVGSNVASGDRGRLDDMANIFWQMHRFVEWTKTALAPRFGTTPLELTAFASPHPVFGPTPPDAAWYDRARGQIYMGTALSQFSSRDNPGSDPAPENGEWHELAHHLFHLNVHRIASAPCLSGSQNHHGYLNPDTCDSFSEGFANFLATVASREIDGATDDLYADFNLHLESNWRAWQREEFAVAALLWDLYDDASDNIGTSFISAPYRHARTSGPTYVDRINRSLGALWSSLTLNHPARVADLRDMGVAPPSIDLLGDEVADVSDLDHVYLMHGFYPVELWEQNLYKVLPHHKYFHYDPKIGPKVGLPDHPRNLAVGRTDYRDADGPGPGTALTERRNQPTDPRERVLLRVRTIDGRPVTGAEVRFTITGDEHGFEAIHRMEAAEEAARLVLLPYFDEPLAEGGELPECDRDEGESIVDVRVTAFVNGTASEDVHRFDNCEYAAAVEASTNEPALELGFEVPFDDELPVTESEAYTLWGGERGWTGSEWKITLTCSDPVRFGFASGCLETELRVDGGAWEPYLQPLVVADEGWHVVEYRSVDRVGNLEDTGVVEVGVDRSPPEVAILNPEGGPGVSAPGSLAPAGSVALAARTTDQSGSASLCFEVVPEGAAAPVGCFEATRAPALEAVLRLWTATTALDPGEYEVTAVATDLVGNVGRSAPVRIRVL